jgi:AAA+ ATPase superfamily predicted ATPase
MHMPFYHREDELAALAERWASRRGEFFVLYGRRRVGKSELLLRSAEGRRALYFEATSGSRQDHLDDLSGVLADLTRRELFREQPLTNWRAAFAAFGELLQDGPIMISLDEFQFVARKEPEAGSLLNRFMRSHGEDPNLLLCIAGSDVSFFEKEIMAESATTYGRRTGSLKLLPFEWDDIEPFVSGWSVQDQVRAYGVFGGVPYYLEEIDPDAPLSDAILRGVLYPGSKLREEPIFLLSQESRINEIDTYMSCLRAIAAGITSLNDIALRVGKSRSEEARPFLATLEEMALVERRWPVTQAGSNKVYYAISDPFLRFWFRFVGPGESRLASRADAERYLDQAIMPQLDKFISEDAYERICQRWTLRNVPGVVSVGQWWGSIRRRENGEPRSRRYEADIAGINENADVVVLGSCKWPDATTPDHVHRADELDKLETIRAHLHAPEAELLFFDPVAFSPRLQTLATERDDVRLVPADALRGRFTRSACAASREE